MAWIKFEKDLLTDPRVLRMAKSLESRWQMSEETVRGEGWAKCNDVALPAVTLICGALVRIWSLADTHIGNDDVLPLGFEELDEVIGIPGFCDLMPVDWLEKIDDHSVKLPHFHAHNGTEAKRKAVTQKRVAAFRSRNAQSLPDQTKTRPEKKVSNARPNGHALALPEWLPREPWEAWLEVRKRNKAPNTERALGLAIRELGKLREEGQDVGAVLEQSTLRGWRGVFAVKGRQAVPAGEVI